MILVLDLWSIGLSCGWDSFNRYSVQGNCKNLFPLVYIVFIHITLVAFLWYDCPAQMFITKYFSWKIVGLIFSLYLWFLFANPFPNPFIRTYINCKTFYNVTEVLVKTISMEHYLCSLECWPPYNSCELIYIYIYMSVCMYVCIFVKHTCPLSSWWLPFQLLKKGPLDSASASSLAQRKLWPWSFFSR